MNRQTSREPTVFVVDDDQSVRDSLRWLLESVGYKVVAFASAKEFLANYDPQWPGCLVLDIRMPEMSGMELQEKLVTQGQSIPVIILTGHGELPMAVRAMKIGAVDFIEKPYRDETLLAAIRIALDRDRNLRQQRQQQQEVNDLLNRLTGRERQVMCLFLGGKSTKEIASRLGLSSKTVDVHRAHILSKMQTDSIADLVRLVLGAGFTVEQVAAPSSSASNGRSSMR